MTTRESVEREIRPHSRRNIALNLTEASLDSAAMSMVTFQTIIVYFISGYVASNIMIGLLSTVQSLMMVVPQMMTARHLDNKGYYKRFMGWVVLFFRSSSLILGILILTLSSVNTTLFIILFYGVYWATGFFTGSSQLIYINFINKVIPFDYRGRFFGIRGMLTSVAGIIGSLIAGLIISMDVGNVKYAYLYFLAFSLDMISFMLLMSTFEPRTEPNTADHNNRAVFRDKILKIIKSDNNFLKYITAEAAVIFALSTVSFETVYARTHLGLGSGRISLMTTVLYISQMAGFFIWGWIVDRHGFKLSMFIGYSVYVLNLFFAVFFVKLPAVIFLLIVFYGFAYSSHLIGNRNFLFNICIANMVVMPALSLAPLINGLIFDFLGFKTMCVISLAVLFFGIGLLHNVRESIQYNHT